ncbi:MAG: tetratricopeptide repeat protein [Oscillatoria sp. SIO1A7]|nr:tetratricopeptide repeat protein [Oscillatoria sp. SIO1A7]
MLRLGCGVDLGGYYGASIDFAQAIAALLKSFRRSNVSLPHTLHPTPYTPKTKPMNIPRIISTTIAILGIFAALGGLPEPAIAREPLLIAQKNPEDFLKRGVEKTRSGDYQGALEDFNEALRRDRNYAQAYMNRGNIYSAYGNLPAAIADYTQVLRIDPNSIAAYIGRASANSAIRNQPAAIGDYTQALKINPNYVEAYIGRGAAYLVSEDLSRALDDLNQALLLDPNSAAAYYNRATVLVGQGNNSGAIRDLQIAARLFQQQEKPRFYQNCLSRIRQIQQIQQIQQQRQPEE